MEKMLTLKEMASVLNFTERTLKKYVAEYNIPHVGLGRDLRFNAAKVEKHLETVFKDRAAEKVEVSPAAPKRKSPSFGNKDAKKYYEILGLR